MNPVTLLVAALLCFGSSLFSMAAVKPVATDLLGKWEGAVEFGKFKFKMVLHVAKTDDGRLKVTMDVPDHGAKGLEIPAILFNSPDIRIEMDQFQTAYNGKLSDDRNEIRGEFEEGPGGRPIAVNFQRSTKPDAPEPERLFTFKAGETKDIRGHWKTIVEPIPGTPITFALNIGRIPDGTFKADLDVLDQGAKDIPASSATLAGDDVEIKWDALQMSFKGKLKNQGDKIEGEWKQQGKPMTAVFTRLNERASLIPKNLSFDADPANADDIRGEWSGRLEIPGQKLRLIVKLGKTPEGTYAGSLKSPDQGSGELPISGTEIAPPKVKLEWKALRAKFEAVLTNNGSVLEGTWEQLGNKMPLKLERSGGAKASGATNP